MACCYFISKRYQTPEKLVNKENKQFTDIIPPIPPWTSAFAAAPTSAPGWTTLVHLHLPPLTYKPKKVKAYQTGTLSQSFNVIAL